MVKPLPMFIKISPSSLILQQVVKVWRVEQETLRADLFRKPGEGWLLSFLHLALQALASGLGGRNIR